MVVVYIWFINCVVFSMYKNIQNSSLELEKLETENKALESQADDQVIACYIQIHVLIFSGILAATSAGVN